MVASRTVTIPARSRPPAWLLALAALAIFAAAAIATGHGHRLLERPLLSIGGTARYGIVAVGVFSAGFVAIGVFSFGVFSLGIASFGLYAVGIWTAGLFRTWPVLPRIWELKFLSEPYRSPETTERLFLRPFRDAAGGRLEAHVFDLACGTGRMTRLLLGSEWFRGRVTSLDSSEVMLGRLATWRASLPPEAASRVEVVRADLMEWQPPSRVDGAALLEATEMLPGFPELVRRIAAAMPPGAVLILTQPPAWMAPLLLGRPVRGAALERLLREAGFGRVSVHDWTFRYQVVHAYKGPLADQGA